VTYFENWNFESVCNVVLGVWNLIIGECDKEMGIEQGRGDVKNLFRKGWNRVSYQSKRKGVR